MSSENSIFIYFISDGTYIKIGRTKDIEKRKQTLQTGSTNNLKLLYIIENAPPSMEQTLHAMAKKYHFRGEWFYPECLDVILSHPWYKENIKLFI